MDNNALQAQNDEYKRLTSTLACIGDGIISTDIEGKVIFMNSSAEEFTGWDAEAAQGKNVQEIIPIMDGEKNQLIEGQIKTAISVGATLGLNKNSKFISKDGNEKFISASCSPIRDSDGDITGAVLAFRDITRIKNVEEELVEERNNFKDMFDASPMGIAILNKDKIIKQINPAFYKIFKINPLKVINQKIGNFIGCTNGFNEANICGFQENCALCKVNKIVTSVLLSETACNAPEIKYNIIVDGEETKICLNVSFVPIKISGELNVMLVIEDITSRKIAEEEMERYKILFEKARDIILFIDVYGKIIDANAAAINEYGYSREELLSINVQDLRKREFVKENYINQADKDGVLFESTHFRKDGSSFPVEVSSQSTTIGKNRIQMNIIRNITQRKLSESQLKRAKEEAEAANRAKSIFLANMSHEIRTPLNGMIGMIDLTLRSNLDKEQNENLIIAKSCTGVLLNVINDILDFSKMEAGKLLIEKIKFNIKDLIEDVIKVHTIDLEAKGLKLIYEFSSSIPQNLLGDPGRLKQILTNLTGNAIKFTQRGNVAISVKKHFENGDSIGLHFSVSDTGIGISKEELELLFISFSQVDSSYTRKFGGTGLGLAISKQLIEMMGGKIWVESEKGKGSTFNFTIKFNINFNSESDNNPKPIVYSESEPCRILLVEDDKVNQMVVERFLEIKGHKITIANNGKEALDILKNEKFDIILMDINMPEMDGIETTAQIRINETGTKKHIPIIALTAYALKGDKEKFLSLGMDGYVAKPINRRELIENINRLIIYTNTSTKSILDKLNENFADVTIDDKIISQSITEISDQIFRLKSAIRTNSISTIESTAHLIKGLSSRINAIIVKDQAFKIELAIRRGNLKEVKLIFIKLESDFNNFKKQIIKGGQSNEDINS